jgi:hypothetical protein
LDVALLLMERFGASALKRCMSCRAECYAASTVILHGVRASALQAADVCPLHDSLAAARFRQDFPACCGVAHRLRNGRNAKKLTSSGKYRRGGVIMRRPVLRDLLLLSGLLLSFQISASDGAAAESRLALVIGQSAYRTVPPLPNAENDAKRMAELLASAGFDVTSAPDLSQNDMRQTISEFAAQPSLVCLDVARHSSCGDPLFDLVVLPLGLPRTGLAAAAHWPTLFHVGAQPQDGL